MKQQQENQRNSIDRNLKDKSFFELWYQAMKVSYDLGKNFHWIFGVFCAWIGWFLFPIRYVYDRIKKEVEE